MSVPQIAAEDGRPSRFSAKTIGRVIRGERDLEPHEADWLAKVLKVPAESFYEDPPSSDDDERMAAMETRLMEQADIIRGLLQTQNGLLARQSRILDDIRAATRKENDAADRLKDATHRADEAANTLGAVVAEARSVFRAGAQSPPAGATKPARKRTPKAAPPSSP